MATTESQRHFRPEGVRSILDWELAHLGDPMEDVGWMCVRAWRSAMIRSRSADSALAGFLPRLRKASGTVVDPDAARFWEVFEFALGIITISQARTYRRIRKEHRTGYIAGGLPKPNSNCLI